MNTNLFSRIAIDTARTNLERAEAALALGDNEACAETLGETGLHIARGLMTQTSSNLTDDENAEYLRLKEQAYSILRDGSILRNCLSDWEEERFGYLQRKACGVTDE